MNFHPDEWILTGVNNHLIAAKKIIPDPHIMGIFYHGSGNYGLDCSNSDIDTKCITIPSFNDIVFIKKPLSTTYIHNNNEHIDFKDIRLYIQLFRKQNLNSLEILYTKYYILQNDEFGNQWARLINAREKISHYDMVRSIKSMFGIISEKYKAILKFNDLQSDEVEKFNYFNKQLYHLLRISEHINRYIAGEPFSDCLLTNQADYLKDVKFGYYNLADAKDIAENTYSDIKSKCDNFIEKYKNVAIDTSVDELLNDVCFEIMKNSVLNDLNRCI